MALRPRANRSTSRLPSNWRERLPLPAHYYPLKVKDLVSRDAGLSNGLCPFHDGPEPTFEVDLAGIRGGWRCSVCGAHGDLIAFAMRFGGLPFPGAVRALIEFQRRPGTSPPLGGDCGGPDKAPARTKASDLVVRHARVG